MTQISQLSTNKYCNLENEPYMSEGQLAYFKDKLMQRKDELRNKISTSIKRLKPLKQPRPISLTGATHIWIWRWR